MSDNEKLALAGLGLLLWYLSQPKPVVTTSVTYNGQPVATATQPSGPPIPPDYVPPPDYTSYSYDPNNDPNDPYAI